MEKLIVVGEKFTDFARRHQNVLTVNEFERFCLERRARRRR